MEFERYKMTYKKELNDKNENNLRILGKYFVKKNINKGKLIINNKKCNLKEFFEIKNIKGEYLNIQIVFYKDNYNKNCFFKDCKSLIKLSYHNNFEEEEKNNIQDTDNDNNEANNMNTQENSKENSTIFDSNTIENIDDNITETLFSVKTIDYYEPSYDESEYIFGQDYDRNGVPNFSIILKEEKNFQKSTMSDTNNYLLDNNLGNDFRTMNQMFYNCSSLVSLMGISLWDTCNVRSMGGMFYNCSSLLFLPDISKWDTCNVKSFVKMFYNCSSLKSLPDISL